MTGKDKHMPLYSSSDIEKYLSGELSDPEMHAMERAALDDPFLADALEGMRIHQSLPKQSFFQQDMASLQKRLDDRVSRNKKRSLLLPLTVKYAAAVILLLGIGVAAWYSLSDRKMKTAPLAASKVEVPAQEPPATQATAPPAAATDSTRIALADGITSQTEEEPVKKDVAANKARVAKKYRITDSLNPPVAGLTSNYSTADKRQEPAAPYANNAANNLNKEFLNNNQRSVLSDSLFPRRDSLSVVLRGVASGVTAQSESDPDLVFLKKPADQLVFTGKVLNLQKIPLAGATLSFKKGQYNFNTVTDANGYFTLRLPKNDTTARVAVNYIGYEPALMKLNTDNKTGNVILLKPQRASLNEVVVTGYGAKRKELTRTDINSVPPPLSETAVPAEGWPAYTNYLELNKNSSQIDTTIRGYESISFIVNKKGDLSHFKVERSLSSAHDSLAIRLVKEGPSWKLLKGKKEKARVIVTW